MSAKDIQLVLPANVFATQESADRAIRKALHISAQQDYMILRKSIDARRQDIKFNLLCRVNPQSALYVPTEFKDADPANGQAVVVGSGPGGLFAALRLLEYGIKPIVIERGSDVHKRKADIALISREGMVNPSSNYSFGEGGAGTFSDGKLYTRSKKRGENEKVLNLFVQFGAKAEILYEAHPHIGTEVLPAIIERMRNCILQHGGEFHLNTCMTDLIVENNVVKGCVCTDEEGHEKSFSGPVILAVGNAARDTFRMLEKRGVDIRAKSIAVGVRLEHPQQIIDSIQYHLNGVRPSYLPAAEYSFVEQVNGRGVYSFCMCPGGFVVPAASDREQVVVNGMSPSNRGSRWANSGMVTQVNSDELPGQSPLKVMEYQTELEEKAYSAALRTQKAPAQRLTDFLRGRTSSDLPVSSYAPGLTSAQMDRVLPLDVSEALRKGFEQMGMKARGFVTEEALIIGTETRTSSPVRIVRNPETFESTSHKGLYPCGEGAGYAGGIVSAAVDGINCADRIISLV
jgi:hypothetical protein